MDWTAKDLQHHAPLFVRREVLKRQAEKFNKEHPDYYSEKDKP